MLRPTLILDSQEAWRPVGVEESLLRYGYLWDMDAKTWNHEEKGGVKRLNFPVEMRQPKDLPAVGYWRIVPAAHLYWAQYWFWWLYNPKAYGGVGKHEGDWEFVQFGCVDKTCDKAVLVSYSQHHGGAKREAWRTIRNPEPRVYVARGSHAMYFGPMGDVEDIADGRGTVLDTIEFREFGDWSAWPGQWGNSTGVGRSPDSPGRQHDRWNLPAVWHGKCR